MGTWNQREVGPTSDLAEIVHGTLQRNYRHTNDTLTFTYVLQWLNAYTPHKAMHNPNTLILSRRRMRYSLSSVTNQKDWTAF